MVQGTPVYTRGDQIWLEDYGNLGVIATLFPPNGTSSTPPVSATPGQPFLLYSIGAGDAAGTWHLLVTDLAGAISNTPFRVVEHNQLLNLSLTGVVFRPGGKLGVDLTLNPSDDYQVEACTVGAAIPSKVSMSMLASIGVGTFSVMLKGRKATIGVSGDVGATLTFWLEHYHPYSLSVGTSDELVTHDLEAASTEAVSYISGSRQPIKVLSLVDHFPIREGRYILRAFFRSDSALQVQESQMLLESDGSWVSLSCCASLENVAS